MAEIFVVTDDINSNILIMDEYGDSVSPFHGENADGEPVTIEVYHDQIVVITEQRNGWTRTDHHWWDGRVEQLFDKPKPFDR